MKSGQVVLLLKCKYSSLVPKKVTGKGPSVEQGYKSIINKTSGSVSQKVDLWLLDESVVFQ